MNETKIRYKKTQFYENIRNSQKKAFGLLKLT